MTQPPRFQTKLSALLLITLILGLHYTTALASNAAFDQGLSAFRNNDYPSALQFFLQARRDGMNSSQLHYNIGVSHFKLNDYPAARAAFLEASKDDALSGLAYYNLALIAYQQREPDQTRHWLQRCRASNPDERLLTLADALQSRLSPTAEPAAPAQTKHRDIYLVSVNASHDDNVTLSDDNQALNASGQSDRAIELLAFYQHPYPINDTLRLRFDASLYQQDYLNLNDYDVGLLRFGGLIEHDSQHDWQLRGDAHINKTFIAGSASSQTLSLQGGIYQPQQHLGLDLQIARIHAEKVSYRHLTGWRYQLSARQSWQQSAWRYHLNAKITRNDRADYRTATRFSSYSPQRLSLNGKIQTELTRQLNGSLKMDWRHSRYRDANQLADGSFLRREEQRWRLTTELKHPLNPDLDLRLQYRYSHNSSTLDGYDYRRNQFHLGILANW